MISKYEIGHPCILNDAIGRIVDKDPTSSFGTLNGVETFSILITNSYSHGYEVGRESLRNDFHKLLH